MKTTIQVSDKTMRQLIQLKERLKKASYDAALREVLAEHMETPRSLAGAFPGLTWSKEDRMQFRTD